MLLDILVNQSHLSKQVTLDSQSGDKHPQPDRGGRPLKMNCYTLSRRGERAVCDRRPFCTGGMIELQ